MYERMHECVYRYVCMSACMRVRTNLRMYVGLPLRVCMYALKYIYMFVYKNLS